MLELLHETRRYRVYADRRAYRTDVMLDVCTGDALQRVRIDVKDLPELVMVLTEALKKLGVVK